MIIRANNKNINAKNVLGKITTAEQERDNLAAAYREHWKVVEV